MNSLVVFFALLTLPLLAEDILPEPKEIVLASGDTLENRSEEILAARRYAAFWNTGNPLYVEKALSPNFMDRILPEGRKQGVEGPIEASQQFRSVIPDLTVEIEKLIVAKDHVVVHLRFQGHFTGSMKSIGGNGQAVDFQGIDIYKIQNGKITDNWHIEDNAKFFKQIGL